MKTLHAKTPHLALVVASLALSLSSFVGCVKASTPDSVFDSVPELAIPKTSAKSPTSSQGNAGQPAGLQTCPPKLVGEYQSSMAVCMQDPASTACSKSGEDFLKNYPDANCSFTDSDGNKSVLQVANGRIQVSVGEAGQEAGGDANSPQVPPSQSHSATPSNSSPSVPSDSATCSESAISLYNAGVYDCNGIMSSSATIDREQLSTCSDSASDFLARYPSLVCETTNESGNSLEISSSKIAREKKIADQGLSLRNQEEPTSDDNTTVAPPIHSGTSDSSEANSDDYRNETPACATKLVTKYAMYLKNTTVCRLGGSRLAKHRKTCVALAQSMLKAAASDVCQIYVSSGLAKAGSMIEPESISDDVEAFQGVR